MGEQDVKVDGVGKRGGRGVRVAVQVVGFLGGLAALGWCLKTALKEDNRQQLAKLWDAPAHLIALMLGLSLLTLGLNGMSFWVALWPVKRLRAIDVLATNGVCTFLGYLPFKLGAVLRFIIHNRRDKIPVATIGAWFAALAVVILVNFAVMCGTAVLRGRIDGVWFGMTLGGVMAAGAVMVGMARVFRGERGLKRMEAVVGITKIEALKRPLRWKLWLQLHAGFEMLASPGAVGGGLAIRMVDAVVQSARFIVAAKIFGVELAPQQAFMVSMLYFIVGVISPSGLVGIREGAVGGLGATLLAMTGMSSDEGKATLVSLGLLVSATEFVSYLIGGGLGMLWLRPDRLFRGNKAADGKSSETAASEGVGG